ncbi:YpoC family protein [Bacillus fonticola]|uniref:YpoC family protein n=1 Tax=Bacillus fonticola TaxID=2728853 RepID=UPI0014756E6E|nr:hypothetical protein [Bacillus fonticola]
MNRVHVPHSLQHPTLLPMREWEIGENEGQDVDSEMLFYNGKTPSDPWPWETPFEKLPTVFEAFRSEQFILKEALSARSVDKGKLIRAYRQLWIAIFWLNEEPVTFHNWEEKVTGFVIKPLNAKERLQFCALRPQHVHAFAQATQLMKELEKIMYRTKTMNNRK